MVTLAAWLFVVLVLGGLFMIVIGNPLIDWLDRRTSRLTREEAIERARLTAEGQWSPRRDGASPWKPVAWTWVIIAILAALS